MFRRPLLYLLLGAALTVSAAEAQQPAPPGNAPSPPKSIFRQVISAPTGRNGYEELVLAGERLQASKLYLTVRDNYTTAPVDLKRRVLADKPVVEALRLVRQGLAKPVFSPRTNLTFETTLPELQTFRDIGRVLAMQQYVQLADGRVSEALDTTHLCLRFGKAVQTDTLISGLVGVAIGSICVKTLGAHLDQLSARECEQLYRICMEELPKPDPLSRLMVIEHATTRKTILESLQKVKEQGPEAAQGVLGLDDEEFAPVAAYLRSISPAQLDQLAAECVRTIDEFYERVQGELAKQPWERQRSGFEIPNTPGAAGFATQFLPSLNRSSEVYARAQAYLRLLACHCAILRYRWEHDRVPATLEELRLGPLAVDPFTGQLLEYHPQGRRYVLTSVGPTDTSDNPQAVNGRVPASVD